MFQLARFENPVIRFHVEERVKSDTISTETSSNKRKLCTRHTIYFNNARNQRASSLAQGEGLGVEIES